MIRLEKLLAKGRELREKATPNPVEDEEDGSACGICGLFVTVRGDLSDFMEEPICDSCTYELFVEFRSIHETKDAIIERAVMALKYFSDAQRRTVFMREPPESQYEDNRPVLMLEADSEIADRALFDIEKLAGEITNED